MTWLRLLHSTIFFDTLKIFLLKISEALAGICDAILHIPEDIMACKDIIEELIPEFINAIINNWGDHDAICKEIFLCP